MALKFGTSGIRGLNLEFTEDVVTAYIHAFLTHAKNKARSKAKDQIREIPLTKIAVAGDLRESTPGIKSLIDNILKASGCEVLDCGYIPTPALALYCQSHSVPGIMITGSHIPADRNGIKFYWPWGEILKEDEVAIQTHFQNIYQPSPPVFTNARNEFIQRYISAFEQFRPFFQGKKILAYQHSAATRDFWKPIFTALGFDVEEIGSSSVFVPVDTETDEAVANLRKIIPPDKHFFALVSSDGDGDRPLVCDQNLQILRGDTLGLITSMFLGANTVVTPVSSNTALELSGKFKNIVRTKIGSPFVIEAMMQLNDRSEAHPIIGFEANGGVLLGSDVEIGKQKIAKLPTRDSLLPVLCTLAMAATNKKNLSQVVTSLPLRFTDADVLRGFPIEKVEQVFQLAQKDLNFMKIFGEIQNINTTDGLRLTFASGNIVHLRPSGNAPEFRCYTESKSPQQARELLISAMNWLKYTFPTL